MYIGVDIGSSFVKIAEINSGGVGKTVRMRTPRVDTGKVYEYEYDVDAIIGFVEESVGKLCASGNADGIIFSTQMHGFVLEKGNIHTNYISWQDERSLNVVKNGRSVLEYLKETVPSELINRGGVNFKCELSLCGAAAYFEESGESPAEYELYTLGSYVIKRMTGNNVTHITNAAPTGMYDIYGKSWNAELIDAAGLTGIKLPRVVDSVCLCGEYNGVPVYPDIGDQQATICGGGLTEGTLNINMGTASQMSMICDAGKVSCGDIYEIRPYFDGKYIKVVSKLYGGRSLQVLADFFSDAAETFTGSKPDRSAIWKKIDSVDTDRMTDLVVNVGFYRSLLFNKGSIENINSNNLTVDDIIISAYENMAKSYLGVMGEFGEKPIERVTVCGKFGRVIAPMLKKLDAGSGREYLHVQIDEAVFDGLKKLMDEREK